MSEHAQAIASTVSAATYSISGALVMGDWLSVLDSHAAAIGVILGALTFMTNFVFQLLNHRVIRARNKDEGN